MRIASKQLVLGLLLLLSCPVTCRADSIFLKSGEVLRGKVLAKSESSYSFRLDSNGGATEIPISNVYIADIDPSSDVGSKNSIILYSKSENGTKPTTEGSKKREEAPTVTSSNSNSVRAINSHADILKNAEQTVALSNARTAEMEKRLEELKNIADSANKSPAASSSKS